MLLKRRLWACLMRTGQAAALGTQDYLLVEGKRVEMMGGGGRGHAVRGQRVLSALCVLERQHMPLPFMQLWTWHVR